MQLKNYLELEPKWTCSTTTKHSFTAYCTGYAVDGKSLMALSVVGAGTAVDSIRASASTGRPLRIEKRESKDPRDYGTNASTKGEKYAIFKSRLESLGFLHYILLNRRLVEPGVGAEEVYAIGEIGKPVMDVVGPKLAEALTIAILPEWTEYLIGKNMVDKNYYHRIHKLSGGGFNIWKIPNNHQYWAQIIQTGITEGAITFSEVTNG